MGKDLVLIGGGGHLSVAVEVARLAGFVLRGVLDSALPAGTVRAGLRVLGGDAETATLLADGCKFHVSVTVPSVRANLRKQLEERGANAVTLIHPRAIVSKSAKVGAGCFIAAGAIVCSGAVLGRGVVLNTGAQVDHDCRIGDDCHIAPGAVLAGNVACGNATFIASGAVIGPNIRVGSRSIVGAGATVLDHVGDGIKVFGTPAHPHDV